MKILRLFFPLLVSGLTFSAQAENTNKMPNYAHFNIRTNIFANMTNTNVKFVLAKENPDKGFWDTMNDIVVRNSSQIAGDRIGPVNNVTLFRMQNMMHYGYVNSMNDSGRSIFESTFNDSVRDYFAYTIPTDKLEEDAESEVTGFFGSFVKNSIGNSQEERTKAVSASAQSSSLDPKNWHTKDGRGILSYGARPLRKNPYVYTEIGLGQVNGRPVNINARVYSQLMDHHQAGDPKVEVSTVFACSATSHILVGGTMFPASMSQQDKAPSGSVRYERIMFKNDRSKFWSLGFASSGYESSVSFLLNSTF